MSMMIKQLTILNFLLVSVNAFAFIQPGIQGHNSGDIIAVRRDTDIAAWCDFTKQIVLAQPNTLCVYNGNKNQYNDINLSSSQRK
jgi:hypothetical protein